MKGILISVSLFLVATGTTTWAQDQKATQERVTSTPECTDLHVHGKLVELNKSLETNGYKMAYFSSGNAPSKNYLSVRLECKAGEQYQINYVLGANASKYQLNVIDPNLNHVVKAKGKTTNNGMTIVTEKFTAKHNAVYAVVYMQQNKENNCIGLSVFKK